MLITEEMLREWGASSGDKDILGPRGISPFWIATWGHLPVSLRIKILFRREVLGGHFPLVLEVILAPIVGRCCSSCGNARVEEWAKGWLSGEDQTPLTAALLFKEVFGLLGRSEYPTETIKLTDALYALKAASMLEDPEGVLSFLCSTHCAQAHGGHEVRERERQLSVIQRYL
jgi:hypothetical protein